MNTIFQAAIEHGDNVHFHALLSEQANHNAIQGAYRGMVMLNRPNNQEPIVDIQVLILSVQLFPVHSS